MHVTGRVCRIHTRGREGMEGIVYLLTNEGMPGLVKIGFTQSNLAQRIRSLNNTSVPFDFECFYAARVSNCQQTEGLIHKVFADKRVNPRREFFLIEPEQAKAAVQLAAVEEVTPAEAEIIPDEGDRAAVERMSLRRRKTSMFDIGIAKGTILLLDRDPTVTCVVADPWSVDYKGENLSLSAAAVRAISELGYEWPSANGWALWTFEGRPLRDIVTDYLAE